MPLARVRLPAARATDLSHPSLGYLPHSRTSASSTTQHRQPLITSSIPSFPATRPFLSFSCPCPTLPSFHLTESLKMA